MIKKDCIHKGVCVHLSEFGPGECMDLCGYYKPTAILPCPHLDYVGGCCKTVGHTKCTCDYINKQLKDIGLLAHTNADG